MMKAILFLLFAGLCRAAITNVRVLGTTATQAVVAYNASSGSACTLQVSQNPGLTPLVYDVDPNTFANSNSDLSRASTVTSSLTRFVVIGKRDAELATAGLFAPVGSPGAVNYFPGRHFSRALQALTTHYGQITCGADTATFQFTTTNIPLGQAYGDPWLSDSAHPGEQPWPEMVGGAAPESTIDPLFGTQLNRVGVRGNNWGAWPTIAFGSAFNQTQYPCESPGSPWTNPCNLLSGSSSTVGNSTAPLVIRPLLTSNNNTAWNSGYGSKDYGNGWTIDQLAVTLTGLVNSAITANRVLDVCLSLNGGASCASQVQQVTMGTSSGAQTVGQYDTTALGVTSWLLDTSPRFNVQESSPHSGTGTVSGSTLSWATGDSFSLYWAQGGSGRIRLDVDPAPTTSGTTSPGTSVTVTSATGFTIGDSITIAGAGAGGNTYAGVISNIVGPVFTISPATSTSITSGKAVSRASEACLAPPAGTTSAEYTITGFTDGNTMTVSGSPPSGQVYWCADNFSVMVWRNVAPADGSTVSITGASMGVIESFSPTYPDNGSDAGCLNAGVQNGFWCMYGGLYWISPANGSSAFYGYAISPNSDLGAVTNPWKTIGIIPAGEAADIDQTQSTLTFYTVSTDPSNGGPLVIQGTFNPASISQPLTAQGGGRQIQNATVASTTAYSITYSNGLAYSNLTPQKPGGSCKTVVCQMASFDPTFSAAFYGDNSGNANSWNCASYGMSAGVLFFDCLALGGDSPAWIFAFEPGDGNPAHAGSPGGPQVIGAINTFNTPNGPVGASQTALTGRSLHALAEAGESGWIQINMHPSYTPVNTTATTIGSGSSPDCSTFGLAAGPQCIKLSIASHSGSYEPYLNSPSAPFTGTPGELRIAQLGDTACVTSSNSSCAWYAGGAKELMTLVVKNYNGVNGDWVFRRSQYGTGNLAVSGTAYLWYQSIQSSLPYTATAVNGAMTAYWNPNTGCSGSPDPHGVCLIQDTNDTEGHGQWRDSGASVATNVPTWAPSILGYGTVYQTELGTVPGTISYGFANLVPFSVAGVNYTNAAPPFAGYYGHPWLFDAGSHPNSPGYNAPPNESLRAFDNAPVQGGQNEPNWTLDTGQRWYATPATCGLALNACSSDPDDPFGYSTFSVINRKLFATGASCGDHPLIDVSGPGSALGSTSSDSYKYCFARGANECKTGSTAGQIFVNCPGVIPSLNSGNTGCYGSGIHGGTPNGVGNDICIGNQSIEADAIRQFTMDRGDRAGSYARSLVSETARVRMVGGFENNRMLPDNSWILFRAEWLNLQREEMFAAKNLPYPPPDSINRGTFVPMPIVIKPISGLSVNNAVVIFGYQEYGAPSSLNCTSRNDACYANAATVPATTTPFLFASETPAGLSCGSGCTVAIPAISQRVLYYQVLYRDGSNNVLAQGPINVTVVP